MEKLTKRVFREAVNMCASVPGVKVCVVFTSPARCVFFVDGMVWTVAMGGIKNAYIPPSQVTPDNNLIAFRNGSCIVFLCSSGDINDLRQLDSRYDVLLVEDGEEDDELDRFIDGLQVIHTKS